MTNKNCQLLNVKLFADGADLSGIEAMCLNPLISGFTTNPTLMRKAGVTNYREFAISALSIVGERPISFEVFSDDLNEMEMQAREIASWGDNIYVKIPVTNTKGVSTELLVERLSKLKIKVNVTALTTCDQVSKMLQVLKYGTPAIISVFAGRIADTGRDAVEVMRQSLNMVNEVRGAELLWASPRELYNIIQANQVGCHIITATNDILNKLSFLGKDLDRLSLETVQMFYDDAKKAGFELLPSETKKEETVASVN
jgi:transaldolase